MNRTHDPAPKKAIQYIFVFDELMKGATDLDEAPKRSASPPSEIGQLRDSRLLEIYNQHQQRLLQIVTELHDPRNASNELLWGASNCITVIAQSMERMKEASTSGNCKQTNTTK